jgi:hypothetical protein
MTVRHKTLRYVRGFRNMRVSHMVSYLDIVHVKDIILTNNCVPVLK